MTNKNDIAKARRIVIKLGTSTVITKDGEFNHLVIKKLIKQIRELMGDGKEFIIVSSGAVGLGKSYLNGRRVNDVVLNQCYAALGQNLLMNSYLSCFKKYNISISQLLLTHDDLTITERNRGLKEVIESLMELGVIAIINQNDPVHRDEIAFRDNDTLSAHISNLINADLLIILSNVDGLYRNVEKQETIGFVEDINTDINGCVDDKKSEFGKGGMNSKIVAAQIAASSNTQTIIANGNQKNVLKKILNGDNPGTLFNLNGECEK